MVDNTTVPVTIDPIDLPAIVLSTISSFAADETTTVETVAGAEGMPMWAGFVGCLVATIFFGSNLVPVKQFSAGDGVFFQLAFCVPVYVIGLIVDLILNNQRLYPLVLVGGIGRLDLFSPSIVSSLFVPLFRSAVDHG